MKKYLSILLVLAMLLALFVGCGSQPAEEPEPPADTVETPEAPETPDTPEAEEPAGPDYSNIKVGVLLSGTLVDGAWSQAMGDSALRARDELGLTEDQVVIVESLPDGSSEAEATIMKLIDEGCNLIIGTSSGYTTNIGALYEKYPDVYFTQFEGGVAADNYCSFTCWDIDAIFMLGYGSALMTEQDQLGMVACHPQASVVRFIDAYAAGVKAANPDATVTTLWSNSWYDATADKECCKALIDSGLDTICYYGNTTAAAAACEEAGVYFTAYQSQLPDLAPNTCLNTFEWNWTPLFVSLINDIANDTWTPDEKVVGTAEDAARLTGWNADIMPAEVIAQCDEMYEAIKAGEYIVMEGPVFDNEGNQVLAEGETFTLDQMINCDFLLDNVIGSLN